MGVGGQTGWESGMGVGSDRMGVGGWESGQTGWESGWESGGKRGHRGGTGAIVLRNRHGGDECALDFAGREPHRDILNGRHPLCPRPKTKAAGLSFVMVGRRAERDQRSATVSCANGSAGMGRTIMSSRKSSRSGSGSRASALR